VTLNRPEIGNSYNDELVCTLITAFDDLAQDDSLKLVWLTGSGEHFCIGPDPLWYKSRKNSGRAEHQQDSEQLARLFQTLYKFPIPLLATVRGQANAAAVGMLCCCDMVLACERSSFTVMDTAYGQIPVLQSPFLVKALGERAARYYSMSGEAMDAYTATRLGLVHKITPRDEIDAMADMAITRIIERSGMSLRQTKAMIGLAANEVFDDSLIETLVECATDIRLTWSEHYRSEHLE
jgi:methylglutaconyl-CoA hydratase